MKGSGRGLERNNVQRTPYQATLSSLTALFRGRIFVPYAQNGSFQQVDFRPFLLSIMEI